MLCGDCEQRFGNWERLFRSNLLDSLQDYKDQSIWPLRYGPYLSRFCASVIWRVIRFKAKLQEWDSELMSLLAPALDAWADFLLGRIETPGSYRLFLMPVQYLLSRPELDSRAVHVYLRGVSDGDVVDGGVAVAKLRGFLVLGYVHPSVPRRALRGWEVGCGEGHIGMPGRVTLPRELTAWIHERARKVVESVREPRPLSHRSRGATKGRQPKSKGRP